MIDAALKAKLLGPLHRACAKLRLADVAEQAARTARENAAKLRAEANQALAELEHALGEPKGEH